MAVKARTFEEDRDSGTSITYDLITSLPYPIRLPELRLDGSESVLRDIANPEFDAATSYSTNNVWPERNNGFRKEIAYAAADGGA